MSRDFAQTLADALAAVPAASAKTAVFVARDGAKAQVNIGPGTVTLPFVGMYLPPAGYPVQLEQKGDQLVVSGPARPLPGSGKITATGSPRATVLAWGVSYQLPYRSSYTPAVNDDVEITWSADGGVIQGKVTATTNVVPPEAAPAPGPQLFHPGPFLATDSGTYYLPGSRWNTNEVWSVTTGNNDGAWFYGAGIKDTIPDTAVVKSASIYLNPRQALYGPPLLQLHTSASRPGGNVAFTGATYSLPARAGWVQIPLGFIDYLKANSGGLGFDSGGYNIFRGTQSDRLSGALDISWEA